MNEVKDFKVAEIVPVAHLEDIETNHYHMCLAHLVVQDERYASFYRRMAAEGKYVLMDNGAAENSQLSVNDLLATYQIVDPTEIVIPDTICDKDATLEKAREFISKYSHLPYRFMAVPQGRTIGEWCQCAKELMRMPRINSIGISKFLNIATGDKYARLRAAEYIDSIATLMYGNEDIEIHLLGCDEGPAIVREIQDIVVRVRGCDSAFAYIAAQAGVEITPNTKRPDGTIDFINGEYLDALETTLTQFEECAGVCDNKSDKYWR